MNTDRTIISFHSDVVQFISEILQKLTNFSLLFYGQIQDFVNGGITYYDIIRTSNYNKTHTNRSYHSLINVHF